MPQATFADVVSAFGAEARAKLDNPAVSGNPEDQLRAPLEKLAHGLAALDDLAPGGLALVGEAPLSELLTRPDYAVSVGNALVGFIEVKAPGKGCDPRKFSDPHDKAQWGKLKSLPNLVYTDGNGFSLWRDGELAAKIVLLEGDIEASGAKLKAPESLRALVADFLSWAPQPPTSVKALAQTSARLCRLLRDEVLEEMAAGHGSLQHLKEDWRKLLFPEATNEQFADGYAQAVTFGLLMARAFEIPLKDGVELAAIKLKKTNTLIGTALNVLTEDDANQQSLKTSLGTLTRVLNEVNWATLSKDKPEAWLYFYEHFLEVYDNRLRKLTGSYYTPPEVVSAMVNLVDQALRGPLFERAAGIASSDVTLADPAVGTGTFLLGALKRIAANVEADQGAGAVGPAITAAAKRLFGFEIQFGPFAVAQLRLLAEMRALTKAAKKAAPPELNLYITDTLGNPFVEEEQLPQIVEAIAKSRREANKVKREQPITVVIGNPPYKEKAGRRGGWIEKGAGGDLRAPLDRWKAPRNWGVGAHGKHLKNLYVYFWRWATLKVFGSGRFAATGLPDTDEEGIVCFITVAGFLNGPGFEKMRDDLRRTCSDIWVIDCSPEGHQPDVPTRIFQGVQQPVCIVLAARKHGKDDKIPACVLFRALSKGKREHKFVELAALSLDADNWNDCPADWRAPFLPQVEGRWADFAPLGALFDFAGPGVMPGRTWAIAPDRDSLRRRWSLLVAEKDLTRKEKLFHPQMRNGKVASRHIGKTVEQHLGTVLTRNVSIKNDSGPCPSPIQYSFRSFDRQWLIGDARLLNDPRPKLWKTLSGKQVFLTALEASAPRSGPALTITNLIPDQDHYKGSFGGRVYPLWADAQETQSNVRADVLQVLAKAHGAPVNAEDLVAYIAAVMAHPAFTARFRADLVRPGLRVPLTADKTLFDEAVALRREVVWLHCYGERFVDAAAGRPKGPPRLPENEPPFVPGEGEIPGAPEPLPETMDYDAAKRRLVIGKGFVENVTLAMRNYEISGKIVLDQWFSYRRRDRTKPQIGDKRPPSPLEKIQPDGWLAEYTTDLLNLLNVLGRLVALEPRQANLLDRIVAGPLVALADSAEEPGTTDGEPSPSAATSGKL
ncbi:type ISP restriction/modification enzyme [Rhodoblastus sp.]|uniref:type ISP restriction/modification enzyme n=1 Tax=Rhodoblastus sp. TaxID=1962975 RepID=UPI003F964158